MKNTIEEMEGARKQHGMSDSRIYSIWTNMKYRCQGINHPRSKAYAGRGIKVCARWQKFQNFYEDMNHSYLKHVEEHGEKNTTLDRTDNNGNYCKENCRWATYSVQRKNSSNKVWMYKGETAPEASKRLGGGIRLVTARILWGWSIEKAFTTPLDKKSALTMKTFEKRIRMEERQRITKILERMEFKKRNPYFRTKMQQARRVAYNQALEESIKEINAE